MQDVYVGLQHMRHDLFFRDATTRCSLMVGIVGSLYVESIMRLSSLSIILLHSHITFTSMISYELKCDGEVKRTRDSEWEPDQGRPAVF